MLSIRQRADDGTMSEVATYENGEFNGNKEFQDAFTIFEGESEDRIMRSLDGPDVIAVRPEEADASKLASEPFADIPVLPDDLETVTEAWLNRWAEWVAAGRPEISEEATLISGGRLFAQLDWNPALHPRDPETGQFVERPFSVPDSAPDITDMSQKDTLEYLDSEGENIDSILNADSDVTVDGVPNDATSIDEIPDDADGEADPDKADADTGTKVSDEIPTPPDVMEDAWESRGSAAIESAADNQGMDVESARERINEELTRLTEDATVRMRLGSTTLQKIIEGDGEFKTQHHDEIETSGGLYDVERREKLEAAKMGVDAGSDPSQKPKYGYLSETDSIGKESFHLDGYGSVSVEFSDDVRERTTFQGGDSLDYSAELPDPASSEVPQPLNNPGEKALDPKRTNMIEYLSEKESVNELNTYTEAQIHGGLTLDDVEVIRTDIPGIKDAVEEMLPDESSIDVKVD